MLVSQVISELKNIERFLGIVEHGSDGGSRPMTGDGSTTIFLGDVGFPA